MRVRAKNVSFLAIIVIAVLFLVGCASATASHPPLTTALIAEQIVVFPAQPCAITCVAEGGNGDSLMYEWDANGGGISGEGSAVTWTAPDAVGKYNITVIVRDGNGGQSWSYLEIEVEANHAPIIESLIAEETEITVLADCEIECLASDQDGDELYYEWVVTGGSISGEGSAVNWTAPDAVDIHTITVTVTDSQGAVVTSSVDIAVFEINNSPVIEGFTVTNAVGRLMENGLPKYIKVLKNSKYYIECTASDSDGDELSYDWWVSEGSIVEDKGSIILWRAPDHRTDDNVIIELVVSDARGDEADEEVFLKVVCTSCELFS